MTVLRRFIFGVLFVFAILAGGLAVYLQGKYAVPVIMYHHIMDDTTHGGNATTIDRFKWQMDFLKKNSYHVISAAELFDGIQAGRKFSSKTVVITFDDGYDNNYSEAFKVLKEYHFPAIIFVITDMVGQDGYITWDQIKEMEQHNVVVGSHTLNHAYLPGVVPQEQYRQIVQSKKVLEENLGHPVDFFAYPSGGFSEEIKDIVQKAGYKGAFATNRGHDLQNKDVYEVNRIRFSNKDRTYPILMAKLSGYYNLFRKQKDPY